jgi:hypothetical protein
MTLADQSPLRADLHCLLATSGEQVADRRANRVIYVLALAAAAFWLVTMIWFIGPIVAVIVATLGLLYWLLYREVKRRKLSDNFVIFGFSPLLVVPLLLVVILRPTRGTAVDQEGVTINSLDNMGIIWGLAVAGVLLPIVMNCILYLALLVRPRRLDSTGVLMRSGKRFLWSDCRGVTPLQFRVVGVLIRGPFSRELRLHFASGVVPISTPPRHDSPAYVYALQTIGRLNIPLIPEC